MSDILRIKLNDSERFLCAVLSHREHLDCQTIIKLYKKVGDEDLFSICKHNKIESIATDALGVCLGLDQLPEHWLESYAVVDRRISSYMKELDRVAKLLSNLNIPLVALKNSGIISNIFYLFRRGFRIKRSLNIIHSCRAFIINIKFLIRVISSTTGTKNREN